MSNCPKPEDKPVNSLWATALSVPALVVGCFAAIVMGTCGLVAWSFATVFSSGEE